MNKFRLAGLLHQKRPQLQSRLMELRFRGAYRNTEPSRHLFMFVTLYVVQQKYALVTLRKQCHGVLQRDPVDHLHSVRICGTGDRLLRHLAVFGHFFVLYAAAAEMHQDLIDGQPMEPRRKCGIAAETAYFTEKLYENFLRQVFSLSLAVGHSKAEGVGAPMIALIDKLESCKVPARRKAAKVKVSRAVGKLRFRSNWQNGGDWKFRCCFLKTENGIILNGRRVRVHRNS